MEGARERAGIFDVLLLPCGWVSVAGTDLVGVVKEEASFMASLLSNIVLRRFVDS